MMFPSDAHRTQTPEHDKGNTRRFLDTVNFNGEYTQLRFTRILPMLICNQEQELVRAYCFMIRPNP